MVLSGQRPPDNTPVDHNLVNADVRDLHKAGVGKTMGTDEATFCKILVNRSQPHLMALYVIPTFFSNILFNFS